LIAQLDAESVVNANSQFWEQMLAMRLETIPAASQFCVGAGHLLATVNLSGRWTGAIEVRMAGGLAYAATAAMMMQPVETVGEADVLDASKEIANMIAGVIKSSLPRPCVMTVPDSAVEPQAFCGAPRTTNTLVVAFRHGSGDMMVWIREQACQPLP